MIKALFSSASGMRAQQTCIDAIANNLANVNTNGFKYSQVNFEDLLYDELVQPGAEASEGFQIPTGVEIGGGVRVVGTAKVFSQGELEQTGRDLDIAIQGRGFFQISLPDGTKAYTRDGAFGLDGQRRIVTADGKPLGDNITVPANAASISISSDGKVYARVGAAVADTEIGQIQLASFPNSGGLSSVGGNLFVETVASGSPTLYTPGAEGVGSLKQAYIERSNVDVVAELVRLITAQRAYEINSKSITAADHMLQAANGLVK